MTYPIRPRTADDLTGCVAALTDVHAVDAYPTHWPSSPDRWLSPRDLYRAWVATGEPDRSATAPILGHVLLTGTADRLAVARLFVVPRARGRGLAAALLDTVRTAAGDRLDLEVADHNDAAVRLYERTGWRRRDSYRADWAAPGGEPALVHRYTLLPVPAPH